MRLKSLFLKDFCGIPKFQMEFGDFTILIGPNGIGKTTILNAVSLLSSSMSFETEEKKGLLRTVTPLLTGKERMRAYLRRNIRNIDEENSANGFLATAIFEHDGKELVSCCSHDGFVKNDLAGQEWYWPGIVYFAKFDVDMVNFQLRESRWDKFAMAFEAITGWKVDPEVYEESNLKELGHAEYKVVVGFWMHKPGGRVYSRKASAGEKKIAKSLSQVLNLEESRQPTIVLVDNLEMHAHHRRHLKMFDVVKELFKGKQVIATTHSTVVIEQYQPREHIVDVEQEITKEIEDGSPNA